MEKTFYNYVSLWLSAILFTISLTDITAQTAVAPTVGDGSSGSPYEITSLENLYWIAASDVLVPDPTQATRWSDHYKQTAFINASETYTWADGGWTPIGNSTLKFTGSYDGNGYTIDGLYINRSGTNYQGLFGYLNTPASIQDLGVTGLQIISNLYSGGLVGRADNAAISYCFSSGSITGYARIGGLIGYNYYTNVSNCYGRTSASGTQQVGGLVGYNSSSTITNCYSTGFISGSQSTVGGFVGSNSSGTINNSFWDTQTSGKSSSSGGTGKTTEEMKTISTFTDAGWDLTNIWNIGVGINDGYPYLRWQNTNIITVSTASITDVTPSSAISGGEITIDPEEINITARGVCWNTSANPTILNSHTNNGAGAGVFTSSITGLSPSTTYYVRAYATSEEGGTVYGNQISFVSYKLPVVVTQEVIDIFGNTATGQGDITVLGSPNPSGHGVCWNTTGTPTIDDSKTDEGTASATGAFTSSMTGLSPTTTYYVRAYATNDAGTGYGDQVSFTTIDFNGSGTELDPYQISTLNDLQNLSANSSYWNKYFIQTSDIDASSTSIWDDGDGGDAEGWTPIGNDAVKFTGSYNGQNYTIDGLFINRGNTDYQGLFGMAQGATIKNLGLTGVQITGNQNTGGLIGYSHSSNISNSYTTGSVIGNGSVGGFVGWSEYGTMIQCFSSCNVTCAGGGGGFIGYCSYYCIVTNCYSTGSVSGNNSGGFIQGSQDATISNCYSTGVVSIGGGFINEANGGSVNNCFWDTEVSGRPASAAGTGNTTSEMKNFETFNNADWDFMGETTNGSNDYWGINESGDQNNGYPFLSWQGYEQKLRSSLTTESVTNITGSTATGNGNITFLGTTNPTGHGVCWNTTGSPTIDDSKTDEGAATAAGSFTSSITGLSPSTTYYLRAYATSGGTLTGYGEEVSFTTLQLPGTPAVTTQSATNITSATATGNGNITVLGIPNPTGHGVCWNTTGTPTIDDSKTDEGTASATGAFTSSMTGLSPSTTYYIRAYATNDAGTGYGDQVSFTTIDFNGSGTELDPYQISTLNDLQNLSANSSYWNKYFIQTSDIDASSTSIWDDGDGGDAEGWTPIGNDAVRFTGSYNGQNYTIDGLFINRGSTDYQGLFGMTQGATIKNLHLTGLDFTGNQNTGGLIGYSHSSNISNSYTTGSVIGNGSVGGFVGWSEYGTMIQCFSSCNVTCAGGGGGFIGYCSYYTIITNCYSTGSVSGNNSGGFIQGSQDATISNCYSTGVVSIGGGFINESYGGSVNNCFWDSEVSGRPTSAAGTGNTTSEMKNFETFNNADWDFMGETTNGTENIWYIGNSVNSGYPFFFESQYLPTGADNAITMNEDTEKTFTYSDFPFNSPAGNNFRGIKVTLLETEGNLKYNGTEVTLNQELSDVTRLTYSPAANASGSPYDTFKFFVSDGVANGISEYTMTINVIEVPDNPTVVVNTGGSVDEGDIFTLNNICLRADDPDGSSFSITYNVTQVPVYGRLTKSGVLINTDETETLFFTQNDIANSRVKYTHDGSEANEDFFKFTVSDRDGNTSDEETFLITINGVNDAPTVGEIAAITMKEDEEYTLTFTSWYDNITDVDNADSTLIITVTTNNSNVILTATEGNEIKIACSENYFGEATLNVTISDGELSCQTAVDLIIESVNDLPHINGLPSSLSIMNGDIGTIDLVGQANDIETPDSLLTWSYTLSLDSLNVNYDHEMCAYCCSAIGSFEGTIELTITVTDEDGGTDESTITVTVTQDLTGIEGLNGIPAEYSLFQNYPNPFNPATTIKYQIPEAGNITLKIYNILGMELITLINENQNPGSYEVNFNASEFASGVYIYKLSVNDYVSVKKLILLK